MNLDQKITDEWLCECCGFRRWTTSKEVFSLEFYNTGQSLELWREESGRYAVYLFGVRLPNKLDTRKQVKQLCDAVGFEVHV